MSLWSFVINNQKVFHRLHSSIHIFVLVLCLFSFSTHSYTRVLGFSVPMCQLCSEDTDQCRQDKKRQLASSERGCWFYVPPDHRAVLLITASCLSCPFCFASAARICDNTMLRCQNGGTCHHHQRCHCPPGFTGVLCERARCQGPGDCGDQLSGRASFNHPTTACQLTLTLVVLPLLIISLCWETWTTSHPPTKTLRPHLFRLTPPLWRQKTQRLAGQSSTNSIATYSYFQGRGGGHQCYWGNSLCADLLFWIDVDLKSLLSVLEECSRCDHFIGRHSLKRSMETRIELPTFWANCTEIDTISKYHLKWSKWIM